MINENSTSDQNQTECQIPVQLEMQLLFTMEQASHILGGMALSTIRHHVHSGRLKRWAGSDRPWYFTWEQLQAFVEGR